MERVTWDEDGWPVVGAGVPSTMPQSSLLDSSGGGYVPRPPLMMHQSYVLQVSQGWDLYLGDKTLTKAKEAFSVHPGLVPGGTVSLRFGEKFLRHRCGKLELSPFDASELFAHDASWMALPGFTDAGLTHVTLRSVNFPEMYVRHKNQELFSTWSKQKNLCEGIFCLFGVLFLDIPWLVDYKI